VSSGRKYLVIGSLACPYCVKAQELLQSKGLDYTFNAYPFRSDPIREAKKQYKWKTIPIVILLEGDWETIIGGYDSLVEYLNEHEA
jgi:glutaredoxin